MARGYVVFALIFSAVIIFVLTAPSLQKPEAVSQFGPFKTGQDLPDSFRPGGNTVWAPPYETIPPSKFFVYIAKKDFWCVWESCGLDGAIVQTLGGYLSGDQLEQPELAEKFGFDDASVPGEYESIVIIGDQNAKVVGIYLNRDLDDVLDILRLHPQLADFSLLRGVESFGPLQIGERVPVRPYGQPPPGTKFYLYVFSRDILDRGPCVSVACLGPGYFDYAPEFSGWFSSDGQLSTAQAFGVDVDELARGEASLVVVADKNAKIVAIHPGKTVFDILTILRQHPELADLSRF